jgi:hypothetical protein
MINMLENTSPDKPMKYSRSGMGAFLSIVLLDALPLLKPKLLFPF